MQKQKSSSMLSHGCHLFLQIHAGSGLRYKASPANQRGCFTFYGRLNERAPSSSCILHSISPFTSTTCTLYISYRYHLYPPNPKENVAKLYEVLSISDWLL